MGALHDIFAAQVPALRAARAQALKQRGDRTISEVTAAQAFGGMREVRALVCDTSVVDPDRGLIIRGIPVLDLVDRIPEEIFFLLLIGRLPTDSEAHAVRAEIASQPRVPEAVWHAIEALPRESHPMSMLSAALLAMEHQSVFASRFDEGAARRLLAPRRWKTHCTLLGALPTLAGGIYHARYGGRAPRARPGARLGRQLRTCWATPDPLFARAMRIAAICSATTRAATCAFACHTVGSVLSNPISR
jgi:citrate synthase